MKRMFAAACGLVFATVLAGCGSTTDNLDFKAPAGYTNKMNTFIMSMWQKGDSDSLGGLIMLMKLPVKVDNSKFDATTLSSSGAKNMKIESTQNIQICGNQAAVLAKATGKSDQVKGKDLNMEMLMTSVGGNSYIAMYMYPEKTAADTAAEAAIKSVCAKSAT